MSRASQVAPTEPSRGIKGAMKQRVLRDMIESVPGKFKILIVDKTSAELLSVCLRVSELMDYDVTLVEDISKVRQPIPKSPAIYFISPSDESLKAVIEDWATKDSYAEAHIFFTSAAPQRMIETIAASRLAGKVKNLKDMLLDFAVPETLSFHFGQVDEMMQLMGPSVNAGMLQKAVSKLTNVAHTLGDNPIIRFQGGSTICRSFAEQVAASIDLLAKDVVSMNKHEPRTILVIVDRSIDPAVALIHDRYYEGALYDLMPLKNMMYAQSYTDRSGNQATRDCLVDEMDSVWFQFRHTFLPAALEAVPAALKQLIADNPALANQMGKQANIRDVSNAIRSLPEFQEKHAKLSLHIDILTNIMAKYNSIKLTNVATLEQKIACKDESFSNLYDQIKQMSSAPDDVKLRLLLLLHVCANTKDFTSDKKQRLLAELKLDFFSGSVANIDAVVSRTGALPLKKRKDGDPYQSQVKLILEALSGDSLSTTDFPFARSSDAALAPTATTQKKTLRTGSARLTNSSAPRAGEKVLELGQGEKIALTNPQKVVVFMIGGITRAEVRAAYEIARELKREAIVGSTSLLSAETFIRQLPGMK